jgi:RNA polymerase sigma-70 factor, ECF subfamily
VSLLGFISRTSKFEALLGESRKRLWRLAYSWSHNRALSDDLVQDTLAKALLKHKQLRDPDLLNSWLCTILANCWHDHLRQRKYTAAIDDIDNIAEADLSSGDNTPEDGCFQNQMIRRVRLAVAQLPIAQREVVTLVDLEECSYSEVAAILEIPIGTVMSRLSRARFALKEALREPQAAAPVQSMQRMSRVK